MQSQSNLSENYQELLNSLIDLHPDLDLKLTQPQYDEALDILKAVYLKVTLKALQLNEIFQQDLKPMDQVTKKDFLQAKQSYLTSLKSQKMEEQETSDADLDDFIKFTQEDIEKYKNNPKKLAGRIEALKELQFIKSVSYALQQTQRNINNLAEAAEANEGEKDMSRYDALIKQWNELHDPITDLDAELQDIKETIERYSRRKMIKQMQQEEEKLALLLRIIEEKGGGPIQSDQEELQSLKAELELDNLESAHEELAYQDERRPKLLNSQTKLEEVDSQIRKIKRLIQLLEQKRGSPSLDNEKLQNELNRLCQEEEIKAKEEAEEDLSSEEQYLAKMTNKTQPKY